MGKISQPRTLGRFGVPRGAAIGIFRVVIPNWADSTSLIPNWGCSVRGGPERGKVLIPNGPLWIFGPNGRQAETLGGT